MALVLSAGSIAAADPLEVTLDPSNQQQTIAGWGTMLGAEDLRTLLDFRNAGMNIMRMGMPEQVLVDPSGDQRVRVPLTSDLSADIAKFNFQLPAVQQAAQTAQWLQQHDPNFKLLGDSWSAPQWMKGPVPQQLSNGQLILSKVPWVGNPSYDSPAFATPWLSNQYNHWYNNKANAGNPPDNNGPTNPHFEGYSGDSIGGRLLTNVPGMLTQFGDYMAAWVSGFQQTYHVPISSISLQNEATFQNNFDSMVLDYDQFGNHDFNQYALALGAVSSAFKQYGVTTNIHGPHANGIGDSPTNPWRTWQQVGMINAVKNSPDKNLINSLNAYASNYYVGFDDTSNRMLAAYWKGDNNVSPGAGQTWVGWDNNPNGVGADGKQIWYMETGDGGPGWRGNSNGSPPAITVALKMHNALVYSNASAYIYLQLAEGTSSPDNFSLLGTSQIYDPTQSKKYDAFMQYSKFVTPGSVRIGASFKSNGQSTILGKDEYDTLHGVDVSAYVQPQNQTLSVVLLNVTPNDAPIMLDVPGGLPVTQFAAYRTSDAENFAQLAPLDVSNGQISFTLPAYSVETLTGSYGSTPMFEIQALFVPEPHALAILAIGGAVMLRRRRMSHATLLTQAKH